MFEARNGFRQVIRVAQRDRTDRIAFVWEVSMGKITVSFGGGKTSGRFSHAELREKLGHCQCHTCRRIFNEHTNEELDKCMDELFPKMKLLRERSSIEFHFADKEYSQEEIKALVDQVRDEIKKQSRETLRLLGLP